MNDWYFIFGCRESNLIPAINNIHVYNMNSLYILNTKSEKIIS